MVRMFIRQTRTNNSSTGEEYLTYCLVRGQRIAGKVRQDTIHQTSPTFFKTLTQSIDSIGVLRPNPRKLQHLVFSRH